jgi:hypothetical protein
LRITFRRAGKKNIRRDSGEGGKLYKVSAGKACRFYLMYALNLENGLALLFIWFILWAVNHLLG